MLGRLQMPIDDAIEHYECLSKKVFGVRKSLGAAKFNHKVLERVIKDAVKQYTGNENAKMFDDREDACKM
ncbi:MAG TPA: hypothetical protein VGO47_09510 [Chlamydiales bacterium]|nr:hypothetical protein [Chlamydiales bacterium]